MKEKTRIQCDAIQAGLGAVLMQGGRPVEYASRALTPTEERYAQIEKEQLAICFAMERFHTYVYARHVTIETDHKPLIAIKKSHYLRRHADFNACCSVYNDTTTT